MPRQKNDGRGRLGGRTAGTPNKDNPLKTLLHGHSSDYFAKSTPAEEVDFCNDEWREKHKGEVFSKFELDLLCMKATDRAKAEIELLSFHTPKMQAISADMSVKDANKALTDRITRLAAGEDIPADES